MYSSCDCEESLTGAPWAPRAPLGPDTPVGPWKRQTTINQFDTTPQWLPSTVQIQKCNLRHPDQVLWPYLFNMNESTHHRSRGPRWSLRSGRTTFSLLSRLTKLSLSTGLTIWTLHFKQNGSIIILKPPFQPFHLIKRNYVDFTYRRSSKAGRARRSDLTTVTLIGDRRHCGSWVMFTLFSLLFFDTMCIAFFCSFRKKEKKLESYLI